MIYYKIRNKQTGLFHKGGVYDLWSKEGKTWTTLGKLRSMLTMNMPTKYRRGKTCQSGKSLNTKSLKNLSSNLTK